MATKSKNAFERLEIKIERDMERIVRKWGVKSTYAITALFLDYIAGKDWAMSIRFWRARKAIFADVGVKVGGSDRRIALQVYGMQVVAMPAAELDAIKGKRSFQF